jgi:hypothetical protein
MLSKNHTFRQTLNFFAIALLPLALVAGCSTPGPTTGGTPVAPGTFAGASGFSGEIVTDATSQRATVVSVNHTKHRVVLKRADGTIITYKAVPGAVGFDDIKAGDEVQVSVAEEMAVFLGRASVPAGAANTAQLHIRVPKHTEAFDTQVGLLTFSAKVTAINDWDDTVTLQLSDGSTKTIKVGEAVNLADVSIGDNVSVQSTEAAVVLLEKP